MTAHDYLVGTVWDAKDGSRSVRVEQSYGWGWLCIRNLESRRTNNISPEGLRHKFVMRETS